MNSTEQQRWDNPDLRKRAGELRWRKFNRTRFMTKDRPSYPDETALRLVVEGTVSETGAEFFRALVKNLAAVMGTGGAWVTEYLPEQKRLRAHAFWLNGAFLEHLRIRHCRHGLRGWWSTSKKLVHIPGPVARIVSRRSRPPGAATPSVIWAFRCWIPRATVIGHLSVLDTKPLPADPRLISLFEIFRRARHRRKPPPEGRTTGSRARARTRPPCSTAPWTPSWCSTRGMEIVRVNPAAERLLGLHARRI